MHITSPRMVTTVFAAAGSRLAADAYLDFPLPRPLGLRLHHNWLLEQPA